MALTVNTNIASVTTQVNLNKASNAQATAMQRLSSRLRINSAKDDAAGLQIATLLTSQIHGLGPAVKHAHDGIALRSGERRGRKECRSRGCTAH